MHIIKILALRILISPLYVLSFLVPRSKKLWLFGSYAGGFNDNSKYLFIYAHENKESLEVKPIWISDNKKTIREIRSKGFQSYYKWSLQGLFYSLWSGVYIYSAYISDINTWTSGNALKINLWHGVPLKKIEFDIKSGALKSIFNNSLVSKIKHPSHYIKPDYVLSTSEETSKLFSSSFRIPIENCLPFGYPRNAILNSNKDDVISFVKKYESRYTNEIVAMLEDFDRTYIYMPTWRDSGDDFFSTAFPDIEKLNLVLKSENIILIIKAHANTKLANIAQDLSNIIFFQNNHDIYPILSLSDLLITDYSSVFFDYIINKKPIIFYPFDKEKYLIGREMYFKYDSLLEGQNIVECFNDLIVSLENKHAPKKASHLLKALIGKEWKDQPNVKLARFIKSRLF